MTVSTMIYLQSRSGEWMECIQADIHRTLGRIKEEVSEVQRRTPRRTRKEDVKLWQPGGGLSP